MKKRILSILLTLCMVLMLCPVTAFAEDYYTVTINFKYGTLANIPEAENPHTFTVAKYEFFMLTTVENCAPYECVGWKESVSGTVYEPWESLPAANLTFDAVYQVQGSLAVTVDGFEVGNTPADCTYSFESTIPGVEFSEDDIQHIRCSKFVFINEEDDEWLPMGETEAFEAGARYWIGISLNNKGLELAPAVTVNGKTPEYCTIATSNGVPIQLQIDCYPSTPAEQSQYTITYDGGEGVEGSIPADTKTHGVPVTLSSDTFTMDGFVQTGWATSDGGEKVYDLGGTYTTNEDITLYPVWSDITKPTGEISIGTKSWKTFLNNITFGLFFKDTQTVTITASDNSGDTVTIEYLLSDNELTVAQLDSADFTAYNELFSINPDNKYVIYAKLTDKSGNVAYINTSGIVLDATDPIIKGLENGKTYCEAQTVTVTEEYIESVKVNGTAVTLDANNQFTLNPAEGTQTIVVTDKAGNETTVTVTVNDGHTYGAWQSNGKGTHIRYCTVNGCDGYEDGKCTGGQATYFKKAVCQDCNAEYGELLTDSTAPTGDITVGTNKWNSFLNTITFGLFFKDTQSVTITATDDSYDHDGYANDKAVKVEYYLYSGDTALTKADLAGVSFTAYNNTFNINPDNKYVVYARLTDHAGNITYISSNGIVLDATAPIIKGLENGKTYCEAQTVTVTEEYIESVKVNGTAVTLDANNQFTLNPAEGTQTIVVTDKAGNETSVTVTVNDGHTADNDDGDCSTPVYCIYHPDTVVVAAKSHDFSGEWHNDGTGHWHVCQNDVCTVSETETPHSGTDDGDCTTAVICECGYVITAANAEHIYGEWHSNGDDTHTRYCTVDGCSGYEDGDCEGGQASYFKKAVCDTCHAEYGALLTDSTAPTGEISIGTSKWNSFLNTITFGLFFKDTQSVTVTASDDSYDHDDYTDDKAVKVEYYLYSGDTALTQADLAGKEFTEYSSAFNINPDNKYVIYAKLTDHAGNITYISSEGVVLDASAPVISGVENGKTYSEAQTVTVTEEYIESVKVNGTAVTLDANNQFVLNPADGTQTIAVNDKAGNEISVTVTVNNGHAYEWQSENSQYWKKCKFCGDETEKKDIPTITINGANTVCIMQDYKFSFTLPEGTNDAESGYEFTNTGGGIKLTAENGMYSGVLESQFYDENEISFKLKVYAKTTDGFVFSDEKTVAIQNEHAGGVASCVELAICDTCGEPYGELDSTNHNLEKISAKDATVTATGNNEYWHCKDCKKYFSDAAGTNEINLDDTVISKLSPEIIEGKGQSITAGEKKELTFKSNAAFSDFIRAQLDGKTLEENNYTVKEGSTVVTLKADYVDTLSVGEHTIGIVSTNGTATTTFTVDAKAVVDNDTKSPQTGDNSYMALWIALLFVSGGALIVTGIYSRKNTVKTKN